MQTFLQYLSEETALEVRYLPLVKEFMRTHQFAEFINKILDDPEHSKGQCQTYAKELALYLRTKGIPAKTVELIGFKPTLPPDAHKDWLDFIGPDQKDRKFLFHIVTLTNDAVIDLTGSQYGKKYGGIKIVKPKDFFINWQKKRVIEL